MLAALLNGRLLSAPALNDAPAIHLDDRGWQYGDGVFETMLLVNGRVRFLEDHWQRLQDGCTRLHIAMPQRALLQDELQRLIGTHTAGVVKFMLTRGRSDRGYRPDPNANATRLWQLFEPLPSATNFVATPIAVRWCETPLARNPILAGIKHLNRLEQVLAQAEWSDPNLAEGLMLDTEGELISGTMSNIFFVLDGVLGTPDLKYSGIRGVMRKQVLRVAQQLNLQIEERPVWPQELSTAQEVFVTNVVRGIRPITTLFKADVVEHEWSVGAITADLIAALHN